MGVYFTFSFSLSKMPCCVCDDLGQTEGRISYPFSASALAIVMVLVNRLCLAESPPIMSPDCGTAIQEPSLTDRDELRTFLQLIVQV